MPNNYDEESATGNQLKMNEINQSLLRSPGKHHTAAEYRDNSVLDVNKDIITITQHRGVEDDDYESKHEDKVNDNEGSQSDDDEEEDEEEPSITITPSVHSINTSKFTHWYPHHYSHTIPSISIPLTDDVIHYLLADSIMLPESLVATRIHADHIDEYDDEVDWEHRNDADDIPHHADDKHRDDKANKSEFFPDFINSIESAISELGGAVFPRIEYFTPSDATWITVERGLKCQSAGDVMLLLKASERIGDELGHQQQHQENENENEAAYGIISTTSMPHLVLRRYVDMHPSRKFRCFVKDQHLIGISQQDCSQYYQHLHVPRQKIQLRDLITEFFNNHIHDAHADGNYVFDVYVNERDNVVLITYKLWSTDTASYLFDWHELSEFDTHRNAGYPVELRLVEKDGSSYYNVSMRSTAAKIVSRLPHIDNIDVSDAVAIDRFAEACRLGHIT